MVVSPQIQMFIYSVFIEDSLYARTILVAGDIFAIYLSFYLIAVVNKND